MQKLQISKQVGLKIVPNAVAATRLRELIHDADAGLRRVVRCGLYIEWLAANLPHGQLLPWLADNCPDVSNNTVLRWRTMAKNLCEWSGLKFANLANLTCGDRLLDLPEGDLPPEIQSCRAKMDELLDSARTPKQLFLDMGFKQGVLDAAGYPKARRGRLPGESTPRDVRKTIEDSAELDESICNIWCGDTSTLIADGMSLAGATTATLQRMEFIRLELGQKLQAILKSRGAKTKGL